MTMPLRRGEALLRERYQLLGGPLIEDRSSQSWVGVEQQEEKPYLLKLWSYNGETPDDYQRALWDAELRTLYRVGSSPGADRSLLVMRDAGVDKDHGCFAMVLENSQRGYEILAAALPQRENFAWLSGGDPHHRRRELWRGLERIADGLSILHEQNMLHRDVRAEVVFFNSDVGPASMRLGGFEWSVRLGVPAASAPPVGWSTPPEFLGGRPLEYRPETDWFGFGMLAIRCLLGVERFANNTAQDRYNRVRRTLERTPPRDLSELERDLLLRLTAAESSERLIRGYEIRTLIRDIIVRLELGLQPSTDEKPLVLVLNQASDELVEHALGVGYVPNEEKPHEPYNGNDAVHVSRLTSFFQRRLAIAQLYAVPGTNLTLLVGEGVAPLAIGPYRRIGRDTTEGESWDLAFCYGLAELRHNRGGSESAEVQKDKIVVRSLKQVGRDRSIAQDAEPWTRHLPRVDQTEQLRASLALFHEFIRCTNQIELLIRDSEIFGYGVISRDISQAGVEKLLIRELERERRPLRIFKIEGGLFDSVQREIESNKKNCRLVALTQPDEDALVTRHIGPEECWEVTNLDPTERTIEVQRVTVGAALSPAPDVGCIRTWGMFGQVALIRRRKRAIDRLEGHSYLLRSLSAPGQVYMDTGHADLPVRLDREEVDEAKQAAIEDILRVRPIYALQGPPGTGKTTLVAHLLRELIEDDPVAQILITAQAHGAVDVLREKVRGEAFRGLPEAKQPLAVRLGRQGEDGDRGEGSVPAVSLTVLELARAALQETAKRSSLQQEWLGCVEDMIAGIRSSQADRLTTEFFELVKRGANLVYCTTSAGDLEELAGLAPSQSFDWAILEEAGKAHGFDLALPLQAGHRWLLIGDHRQLPPYRFDDYSAGIAALDEVVASLLELPDRAGGLVDIDWTRTWQRRDEIERDEFRNFSKLWLNTFERVFGQCETAPGQQTLTISDSVGAAAGMLSGQHRMHPKIGELISGAYYGDRLVNKTTEGTEARQGRAHPFVRPAGISGKAIVWLNLPSARVDARFRERGPSVGAPRYTNDMEVEALRGFIEHLHLREDYAPGTPLELAVLSPYNQQVALINRSLRGIQLPGGVELKRDSRAADGTDATSRIAHTVDSFQGNQADVIVVSLVRNNEQPPGEGLGFLTEATRLNVLLSRAERLLVLIGSWDFFQDQLLAVPLDDVRAELWHWKKVLTTLDGWFDSEDAIRMDFAVAGLVPG